MPRKASAQISVMAWYILNLAKSFIFSDAHAITTVMLEQMRTMVFVMPSGMFNKPCGESPGAAPTRSRMKDENNAPNNITSDARKSHMPTLALHKPVSARGSDG